MTSATSVAMILGFALPYLYLSIEDWKNSKAFEAEYLSLLELEQMREESRRLSSLAPAANPVSSVPAGAMSVPRLLPKQRMQRQAGDNQTGRHADEATTRRATTSASSTDHDGPSFIEGGKGI